MAGKRSALQKFNEAMQSAVVNTQYLVVDGARAISDSAGAASLHAMVRQGARELAQALPAFPSSNIRPVEEQGQIFNPTPLLVTEQLKGKKLGLDLG